jgi:hypothetical protein
MGGQYRLNYRTKIWMTALSIVSSKSRMTHTIACKVFHLTLACTKYHKLNLYTAYALFNHLMLFPYHMKNAAGKTDQIISLRQHTCINPSLWWMGKARCRISSHTATEVISKGRSLLWALSVCYEHQYCRKHVLP